MKQICYGILLTGLVTLVACSTPVTNPEPTDPKPEVPAENDHMFRNAPQAKSPQGELQQNHPSASNAKPEAQALIRLAYHTVISRGIAISGVCFDDRNFQLRVADQPEGCGSRWMDAKSAAMTYQGLAAVNGGFFTPEGKPLGLLIEDGIKRGNLHPSTLGSGIFTSSSTASAIVRREDYLSSGLTPKADHLLQSGPMLVEHGKPTDGLSNEKNRTRSFIAWDGRHHWMIGRAAPSSLKALADALTHIQLQGFKITTALNLDGGRSSDLWVGKEIENGDKTHRTFLNKAVRNYLVLTAR